MFPRPYEIYEARVKLNKASYSRPCVVITLPKDGNVVVLAVSTAMGLYRGLPMHFKIDSRDSDFVFTGLTADRYIIGDRSATLDLSMLIRKRGELRGELLKRFKDWIE